MPRRSRSRQNNDRPDDILTVAGGALPALARYGRDDDDHDDEDEELEVDEDLEDEEWEDEEEEYEEEDLDELEF